MRKLSVQDRLLLMKFVCSFAWTDLEIADEERDLLMRFAAHEDFGDEERRQIVEWIKLPPPPEEVDPTDVPREHRRAFLEAARAIVEADGKIGARERELLDAFEELLRES